MTNVPAPELKVPDEKVDASDPTIGTLALVDRTVTPPRPETVRVVAFGSATEGMKRNVSVLAAPWTSELSDTTAARHRISPPEPSTRPDTAC
eukprot:3568617-Rhodomonas_salina.1